MYRNMPYLVKLCKAGKDIKTCGYNDLIFTSEFPLLKIHDQGEGSTTIPFGALPPESTVTIPHSVGEKAMFFAFTEWWNDSLVKQSTYRQFSFAHYVGVGEFQTYQAYTDASNLYLYWHVSTLLGLPVTIKYFYFIFEEPITL